MKWRESGEFRYILQKLKNLNLKSHYDLILLGAMTIVDDLSKRRATPLNHLFKQASKDALLFF